MPSSRRDHAPAALGNSANEINGSGHHGDSVVIRSFAFFQLADFLVGVELWGDGPNHFDGAHPVGDGDHLFFIDVSLAGPDAPLALHGTGGIDENSVEIKEDSGATKNEHSAFYHRCAGYPVCTGRIS